MDPSGELRIVGLSGIPEIRPGDDLTGAILTAAAGRQLSLESGDVLVVAQKVISKAEGRIEDLDHIQPSGFAETYARTWNRDARLVELVLRESRRIVRMDRGIIISETRHGFICANAGIDRSNVPGATSVALLPVDPDASAESIRAEIARRRSVDVAVLISDSFGRPWREGATDVAIGVAGMNPLLSYIGRKDPYGYDLRVSVSAVADELCGAAELVLGKVSGTPVALLRGFRGEAGPGSAADLVRRPDTDMFR